MNKETHFHSWYAVIQSKILLDETLSVRQKMLIAVLNNMMNNKGYAFPSNAYLSKILSCSIRSVQNDLKDLEGRNIIGRIIELNKDMTIKKRTITVLDSYVTPMQNMHNPHAENDTMITKINIYNVDSAKVTEIYKLYPTNCPTNNRRLSKSKNNKKQLASLLNKKEYTPEELINIISKYNNECRGTKTFMKDFTTFLNNIPDFDTVSTEIKKEKTLTKQEQKFKKYLYDSEFNSMNLHAQETLSENRARWEYFNDNKDWKLNWTTPSNI